jgi:hypothetical protein
MGHNSGLSKVGALGKQKPLKREEIEPALESGQMETIQDILRPHVEQSVETLVKAQTDEESKWTTRVSAAKTVLEIAHGKPAPMPQEAKGGGGGLVVNILNLASGEPERVGIAIQEAIEGFVEMEVRPHEAPKEDRPLAGEASDGWEGDRPDTDDDGHDDPGHGEAG